MRSPELTNIETADLCRELALLLHSGIGAGDALYLMAEEEKDRSFHALLSDMAKTLDEGGSLHQAFLASACFPSYVTGLIRVGEEVGRTEETLNALAVYYENREATRRQLTASLAYPSLLLLLMLAVITVLLSKVLPVFNEIYVSLGSRLDGIAGTLLLLGQLLDRALPILCALLLLILLFAAHMYLHRGFRAKISGLWQRRFGDRGISRKMNNARFAQALSMGLSSGMLLEDAVGMAASLLQDCPAAAQRCTKCRDKLSDGAELSDALLENELLDRPACRLLTLAMRSGSGDSVMEEIARRSQDDARLALESAVGKVEPALVLLTSCLVGLILLSVMLPLMNIMTAI